MLCLVQPMWVAGAIGLLLKGVSHVSKLNAMRLHLSGNYLMISSSRTTNPLSLLFFKSRHHFHNLLRNLCSCCNSVYV